MHRTCFHAQRSPISEVVVHHNMPLGHAEDSTLLLAGGLFANIRLNQALNTLDRVDGVRGRVGRV